MKTDPIDQWIALETRRQFFGHGGGIGVTGTQAGGGGQRQDARLDGVPQVGEGGAAGAAVAMVALEAQLAVVCEAPASARGLLLELTPQPEALIPRLPEAEFCFTLKAIGIADAHWLIEYATPEQIVAAVDLDAVLGVFGRPRELHAHGTVELQLLRAGADRERDPRA